MARRQHPLPETWWGPGNGHQGHRGIEPRSSTPGEIGRFTDFLCPKEHIANTWGEGMCTERLIQQSMSQPFEWKQSKQDEIELHTDWDPQE